MIGCLAAVGLACTAAVAWIALARGPRSPRDARRLGPYVLGRRLGQGAMGVVYEARHLGSNRAVAVKLLPADKTGERTIARFEREVRYTKRLQHENSVRVYDHGRAPGGELYYAMEYVDGPTLTQLVAQRGPVGAARVARILGQAARALGEAHAIGLVHRDIKPDNIMLSAHDGSADIVKVLDFGLAKGAQDVMVTQEHTLLGTPAYLAPEAITSADDIGPAADVYALGAVAYFLLTGRAPFTGDSLFEVCAKHVHETPVAPSTVLGAQVDPALEALVLRCLAKDPADRPRDGAALAAAVTRGPARAAGSCRGSMAIAA